MKQEVKLTGKSSTIEGVRYDVEKQTLEVSFKNPRTGVHTGTYDYYLVPESVVDEIRDSEKPGSVIREKVNKAGYDYRKIS